MQCCHGDGSGARHVHIKYHGLLCWHIVLNCLRLLNIYCCHGNNSDARTQVCTAIRTIAVGLRLFTVVIVAMGMSVQSITAIRALCWW